MFHPIYEIANKKKFNDPQYPIMASGSVSDAPDCSTVLLLLIRSEKEMGQLSGASSALDGVALGY